MSASNGREKTEADLLDSVISGRAYAINKRALPVAVFFLISLILGILLGSLLIQNISLALLLATALLLMVISVDLSRAWVLLFVVSTLSGLFVRRSTFTLRIDQVIFVWIVLVWLAYFLRNEVRLHKVPLAFPILGLLMANIVSSYLNSPEKTQSYQSCLLFALYLSMYFFTVNILAERKELIKKIPLLLVALGILQAIYSLVALLLLSSGVPIFGASRSQSGLGITVNGGFQESNIFAAFMVVVTMMILAHLIARSSWHKGFRLYATLSVVIIMLLLTFTRAAWISFAIVAIVTLFVFRPRTNFFNPRSLAVIIAGIAFMILVGLPLGNFTSGFAGGSEKGVSERIDNLLNFSEGSGGGRVEVQTTAIQRWKQNPILGNGTFAFPAEATGTATPGSWLYSSLIQSLHDTGVVGLSFLLWIYIGGLVIGIRGYFQCKTVFWKATIAGSTLGWLALIIASQASSFIWLSFPWIFLGVMVSWTTHAPEIEQTDAETYKPGNLITK